MRIEAFVAGAVVADELAREKKVHLARIDDVDGGEQVTDSTVCTGFFERFSGRAAGERFAQLHEAGRHGPVAVARFYRSLAEQDLAVPFGHAADDDQRILVVHGVAALAYPALAVVVFGNLAHDGLRRIQSSTSLVHLLKGVVPGEGIEPSLCLQNRILNPARLPVPPSRPYSARGKIRVAPRWKAHSI